MKLRITLTLRNEAMIAAREELGLCQKELAERAGVPFGFVCRCEKLIFPKRECEDKLYRLAAFLNVTMDDILPMELLGETVINKYVKQTTVTPERLLEYQDDVDSRNLLPAPDVELAEAEAVDNVREVVLEMVKTLDYREQEIIKLRHGLDGRDQFTRWEIARIFKVTVARIQQVEQKAFRKLQHPTRTDLVPLDMRP